MSSLSLRKKRRDREMRGRLELFRPVFDRLVKKFPHLEYLEEDWNYREENSALYVAVSRFNREELTWLQDTLRKEGSEYTGAVATLSTHINAIDRGGKAVISELPVLETALINYIKKDIIEGWLFKSGFASGLLHPLLVTDVQYHPAHGSGDNRSPARTTMKLRYWSEGKLRDHGVTWHANDLNKTVEELLLEAELMKETPKLVETYWKNEAQFLKWRKLLGEQFIGSGTFTAQHSWDEETTIQGNRLVVDDRCDSIENRAASSLFYRFREDPDGDEEEVGESTQKAGEKEYTKVPIWPYIWCFNLETYTAGWVNMDQMKPYVYRPELRDKLILPPDHSELIDALAANMDVLMEDIVRGKTGGTTILCKGPAGTGKTLTAEIYSEIIKRPLYRVHSGQLGTNSESVEEALKIALDNSKRWRAVLLIDEADVFLMQRGESLERNAVVGVFLRTLEYYDGLLFLTTNRSDAIDEAILSRCIAQITYTFPEEEERFRLWQTLSGVYNFKLGQDDKTAKQLAKSFVATGRDIKGLIRLVMKYSHQRKKKITVDDVKRMAMFRGLSAH